MGRAARDNLYGIRRKPNPGRAHLLYLRDRYPDLKGRDLVEAMARREMTSVKRMREWLADWGIELD